MAIICLAQHLFALPAHKRVLILNSYSNEDPWTAEANRGILAALVDRGVTAEFFVENLDVAGTLSAYHLPEFRNLMLERYTHKKPDIIITTGNEAFIYAVTQGGTSLPDVPVVFCSLTNSTFLKIMPQNMRQGLFSEDRALFLLREITRLHPDAPAVAVVVDSTPRGFHDMNHVNDAAKALSLPRRLIIPVYGLDLDGIMDRLSALEPGSVVILGHCSTDDAGEATPLPRLVEAIQSACNLPVYSLLEEGAALGVLASVTGRGYQRGYETGEIAFDILSGTSPESISLLESEKNRLLFNYAGMKEFGLTRGVLPPQSIILGDPFATLLGHVPLIFGNLLLLMVLGVSALYLTRSINARKRVESELLLQAGYWRSLFESSPQGILVYDETGRVKETNPRFREIFRLAPRAVPVNVLPLLSGAGTTFSEEDVFPGAMGGEESAPRPREASVPDGDGGIVHVSFLSFQLPSEEERADYCALFEDIGERKALQDLLARRTVLQTRMAAISSGFVVSGDFRGTLERALLDMLSISKARLAVLFVMSYTGALVPELEVISPGAALSSSTRAPIFSEGEDFFWKSLLKKDRLPTLLVVDSTVEGMSYGGREFLRRRNISSVAILPLLLKGSLQGFLALADPDMHWAYDADEPVLSVLSSLLAIALERRKEEESLRMSHKLIHDRFSGAVSALCQVSELRDMSTAGHQKNVSALAESLAGEMGLSDEIRMAVRYAGLVHDLGKLYIPAEILGKPHSLSDAEYMLVKKHPEYGHDILSPLGFPWPLADIVLQHHERMNGTGYPFGLTGESICLEARILSVADAFDAMTSDRPYRKRKSAAEALGELAELAGSFYDRDIAMTFIGMIEKRERP